MTFNNKDLSCNIKSNIEFFFHIDDDEYYENKVSINETDYINEILKELDQVELSNDLKLPQMIHYNENYTVKELLIISEYYGFAKELKTNKCNKDAIVQFLVDFESNPVNSEIVFKRQNMWFYINELKNDKFMKKYVIW
jgi:hypothetical protein